MSGIKAAVNSRNVLKKMSALNYEQFEKSLLGVIQSQFLYILSLNCTGKGSSNKFLGPRILE